MITHIDNIYGINKITKRREKMHIYDKIGLRNGKYIVQGKLLNKQTCFAIINEEKFNYLKRLGIKDVGNFIKKKNINIIIINNRNIIICRYCKKEINNKIYDIHFRQCADYKIQEQNNEIKNLKNELTMLQEINKKLKQNNNTVVNIY